MLSETSADEFGDFGHQAKTTTKTSLDMGAYGSSDNCSYTDFRDMAKPTMHIKKSKYCIYRLRNISSGLFVNEQVELGQPKYTPGHKLLCQAIAAVQYLHFAGNIGHGI